MCRLDTAKRVTVPNGRTFLAKCKRVARSQLPANIVLKRTYIQRSVPRGRKRRQRGRGLFSFDKLRSALQSNTAQGLVNKFVNKYSA